MDGRIGRRTLLAAAGGGLLSLYLKPVFAVGSPEAIEWYDLVPPGPDGAFQYVTDVTEQYNGKTIVIAGYVVPLEFSGTGSTEFLLVPYVGACVHVPPPPPNQLILVNSQTPYQFKGLFDPVYVTGEIQTETATTSVAPPEGDYDGNAIVTFDVGYSLTAIEIEPYVF